MQYENKIKRFILRKDFFRRAKRRLQKLKRKVDKNEFDDLKFLYSLVDRQPEVILDCGANIGFVTHQLKNCFPNATIHAFEPNPTVYAKLSDHYKDSDKIKCHNMGIADKNGELIFNVNANSGTSSFLNPTSYHTSNMASKRINPIKVPVCAISDLMQKENIRHIDILKLDIEGYEIKALQGINNLLEEVSLVFTEVNLIPTYEGQPLIEDIIIYLRERGFHVYNFYGINENKDRQANITNLLFMSSRFKDELISKGHKTTFSF